MKSRGTLFGSGSAGRRVLAFRKTPPPPPRNPPPRSWWSHPTSLSPPPPPRHNSRASGSWAPSLGDPAVGAAITSTGVGPAGAAAASSSSTGPVNPPTRAQLIAVFQRAAIPMIGFGFVDQTIMLQAGHAIDCTIGVTFGLSTLTSAAFGQVCSDASGAIFGSTLERLADRAGFPSANLTSTQKSLKTVQRTKFAGTLLGVISGCLLGLLNLLLIDTERSSTLKLQAFADDDSVEFDFSIEASNAHASNDDESSSSSMAGGGSGSGGGGGGGEGRHRIPTTVLTVRGPDVDGVLASMTAALCAHGCSLVELHAGAGKQQIQQQQQQQQQQLFASSSRQLDENGGVGVAATTEAPRGTIKDVFHVVKRDTGLPFDDDELEDLAKTLLEATRTPMNVHAVKSKMKELERLNANLKDRVQKLEQVVIDKQITIIPKPLNFHPTKA